MMNLANRLWFVNTRLLEIIGVHQDSKVFVEEKISFMKWFDWFMLLFENHQLDISSRFEQEYHNKFTKQGGLIYWKILKATHSYSQRQVYWLYFPKNTNLNQWISETQLLLSESAVDL
jgi:hypothetical protein